MNCKQGDLAVVVKSCAGNEGKIFTCLRLATPEELPVTYADKDKPTWIIDRRLNLVEVHTGKAAGSVFFVSDYTIKPLRDQGGEDEILRLAGKPLDSEITKDKEIA